MPGILPYRVVAWGKCENCKKLGLGCDSTAEECSPCVAAGTSCIRNEDSKVKSRIAQACDRCHNKNIRCDGVQPSCSPCRNVGFQCAFSRISRRAFTRSYTESLEERVKLLEAETRKTREILEARDEKIHMLSRIKTPYEREKNATSRAKSCQRE